MAKKEEERLEQRLFPELKASVTTGLKLKDASASKEVGDVERSLTSGGSANWAPMGWAVRYRGGEAAAKDQWRRFFAASRKTFMGTEMLSLIYWWGHVLPVAAVAEHAAKIQDAAIIAAADEWLRYYFGTMELMRDPVSGAILMVGMRSGGPDHPEHGAAWLGWLRALARGEDRGPWEARGRELNLGMKKHWEYPTALALRNTLAKPAASTDPLPAYGLLAPVHVYRTEEGLAVWCERNVNSNTTPLMGAVVTSFGKPVEHLPVKGGKRIRDKFEDVTCTRVGDRLVYDSSFQGHAELRLPGGAVVQEITLGIGVDVPHLPDLPAAPDLPERPASGPDLSEVADLLADLQLPNKQKALQRRIVAELRNGPQRSLAVIADDVATFGINPDQAQGKPWQKAIGLLRAT